jgi:hypothetical protein
MAEHALGDIGADPMAPVDPESRQAAAHSPTKIVQRPTLRDPGKSAQTLHSLREAGKACAGPRGENIDVIDFRETEQRQMPIMLSEAVQNARL